MGHQEDRDQHEAASDKKQGKPLEPPKIACADSAHDGDGGQRDTQLFRHTEVVEAERNSDKLGDNGQGVQKEQVDDAKRAQNLPNRSKISRAWPRP
jgi:hypothetical protein